MILQGSRNHYDLKFIGNIHGSQSMTETGAYVSMGIGGDSLVFWTAGMSLYLLLVDNMRTTLWGVPECLLQSKWSGSLRSVCIRHLLLRSDIATKLATRNNKCLLAHSFRGAGVQVWLSQMLQSRFQPRQRSHSEVGPGKDLLLSSCGCRQRSAPWKLQLQLLVVCQWRPPSVSRLVAPSTENLTRQPLASSKPAKKTVMQPSRRYTLRQFHHPCDDPLLSPYSLG